MKYGIPAICPKCPEKHYFGLLIGPAVPTMFVKIRRADVCGNCSTPLVRPKLTRSETPVL